MPRRHVGREPLLCARDHQSRHPARDPCGQGRNADVIEYTVNSASGDVLFKAARYYGFRRHPEPRSGLETSQAVADAGRQSRSAALAGPPHGGKQAGAGLEYGYVEVMACPGGCTNGGGQSQGGRPDRRRAQRVPAEPRAGGAKGAALSQVDEAYFSGDETDAGVGDGGCKGRD